MTQEKIDVAWPKDCVQMTSQLIFTYLDNAYMDDHRFRIIGASLVNEIPYAADMKIVCGSVSHKYEPQGYTEIAILSASSISAHTYPEKQMLVVETSISREHNWLLYRNWIKTLTDELERGKAGNTLKLSFERCILLNFLQKLTEQILIVRP